jgi:hypothetical protein
MRRFFTTTTTTTTGMEEEVTTTKKKSLGLYPSSPLPTHMMDVVDDCPSTTSGAAPALEVHATSDSGSTCNVSTCSSDTSTVDHSVVQWGETVILRVNNGAKYILTPVLRTAAASSDPSTCRTNTKKVHNGPPIIEQGQVRLSKKLLFDTKHLVGCKYGMSFEVDSITGLLTPMDPARASLLDVRVPPAPPPAALAQPPLLPRVVLVSTHICHSLVQELLEQDGEEDDGNERDNRNIQQANDSQQLTESEIVQLKADVSGAELVKRLAAGNMAFSQKTKFSKEKYLARKQLKYVSNSTARARMPVLYTHSLLMVVIGVPDIWFGSNYNDQQR